MRLQIGKWGAVVAAATVLTAPLAGCSEDEPPEPGTPATLSIVAVQDTVNGTCEGTMEWSLTPRVMVGNRRGTVDDEVSDALDYDLKPHDGECLISFGSENLRPGVWALESSVGGCTFMLTAPITSIRLDDSYPSCDTE